MKRILFLLTVLNVSMCQAQCDVAAHNAISLSYEYSSISPAALNARYTKVAQDAPWSYAIGVGIYSATRELNKEMVTQPGFSMSASLSYRVVYVEYAYSLHTTAAVYWYDIEGVIGKAGLRLMLPTGTKAFFIEPAYTTRKSAAIEAGLLFQL